MLYSFANFIYLTRESLNVQVRHPQWRPHRAIWCSHVLKWLDISFLAGKPLRTEHSSNRSCWIVDIGSFLEVWCKMLAWRVEQANKCPVLFVFTILGITSSSRDIFTFSRVDSEWDFSLGPSLLLMDFHGADKWLIFGSPAVMSRLWREVVWESIDISTCYRST